MARYATHDHKVVLYHLIGEEPVYREVLDKDGWHWKRELWYTRKLYDKEVVNVDCTLDIPEGPKSTWYRRSGRTISNEERLADKNCYWWLEYYPNIRSNKDFKQLTNGAVRSKVRQQLHNAIRDYGRDWDEDDWYDVDVFVDSKHVSAGWWD
jgi:hypothetical protein